MAVNTSSSVSVGKDINMRLFAKMWRPPCTSQDCNHYIDGIPRSYRLDMLHNSLREKSYINSERGVRTLSVEELSSTTRSCIQSICNCQNSLAARICQHQGTLHESILKSFTKILFVLRKYFLIFKYIVQKEVLETITNRLFERNTDTFDYIKQRNELTDSKL